MTTMALRGRKPPPTPKFETNVLRDSNPDFRINPYSDPDVCRICPKMLWMHYLVGVSHFAKYMVQIGRRLYEKCKQMSKNPLFRNGEKNEKVIRNPHAVPDHHQKLITFRGSPLAHAGQVWSTSVSAFASYPVYSMTE